MTSGRRPNKPVAVIDMYHLKLQHIGPVVRIARRGLCPGVANRMDRRLIQIISSHAERRGGPR